MGNEWPRRVKDYTLNFGLSYWLGSSDITEIGNTGGKEVKGKYHRFNSKYLEFAVCIRNPSEEAHGK